MSDGKIVIDVDLDSRKAEKSVDDLNSKIEGAFQDKAGRWRAADGRFLTMAEKADMLGESFEDMGKKGENSLKGIEPSAQTASIGIGKIVTALGLMKLASSAVSLLKSSLDGAITRYDTMNNFPKVMKQLGFSTEESAAAVDKLADGVTGLPTPLNEIVSSAQGLAVMTGDLDGATDTALALNNAFLASGASSADASRGLDQYVQMLAKGEVDMQSWRTLQETMGLALNETAKAFGFTGKAAQNDLYAALQDGSITFDQFNDKLIELDGGVDGFAKRARTASGGIATAFANMRTAAVRGLEGIIRSIDESLAAVNFPSIQQMIENFGKTFENALKKVAAAIPPVINFIANMINILKPFAPIIMGVVAAILTFSTGISVINGVSDAIESLKTSFDVLGRVMKANPMLIIIAALVGLGIAFYTAYQKSETFRNAINKIGEVVKNVLGVIGNTGPIKKLASSLGIMELSWRGITDQMKNFKMGIKAIFDILSGKITNLDELDSQLEGAFGQKGFARIASFLNIINDMKLAFKGFKGVITGQFKSFEDLDNLFKGVFSTKQTTMILNFGKTIKGIIGEIKNTFMSAFGIISDWWGENQKSILSTAKVVWGAIKSIFSGVFTVIVAVVKVGLDRITEFWNMWGGVITAVVKSIWSWISNAFETTLKNILTVVGSIITQIKNIFVLAMNVVKGIVQVVLSAMEGDWSGVLDGIKTIVSAFWEYIKDTFANFMNTAKELVNNGIEGIKGYFSDLKNIDLKAAGKSIIDKFLEAWSVIPEFFSNLWNSITSYAAGIWSGVVESWNSTIESIKAVWGSIGEFFSGLWGSITTMFSELWSSITATAQVAWTIFAAAIMTIITPFIGGLMIIWDALKEGLSNVWLGIQTAAQGAWELIKAVIMAPILLLIDLIMLDFDQMKLDLALIWESIKLGASMVWEGIKTTISGLAQAIVDFAVMIFTGFMNSLNNIWMNVKSAAITAWENIKTSITNIVTGFINGAINAWNNFKVFMSSLWSAIKNTASNTWNSIKNGIDSTIKSFVAGAKAIWNGFKGFMSSLWSGIKSTAINAWETMKTSVVNTANNLVSGAKAAWDTLKTNVSDTVNSVKGFFDSLRNIDLYAAGKAIIDGFLNGLKAAYESVKTFVGGIADWIRDHKGPISYDKKLLIDAGEAIMFGLNRGLENSFDKVKGTVLSLTDMIDDTFSKGIKDASLTANLNTQLSSSMDKNVSKFMMPRMSAEAALGIGGRMSTSPNSVMNSNVTNNYTTAKEDTEVVRLLKVIANKPFLAEIDGKRVTKAISQEMDKSQGNRIKLSDWGIEING